MQLTKETLRIIKKKFGLNLKEVREQKGLTQLELATLCDSEVTTISRIENGRTNVTLGTIISLSNALGIDPNELLHNV